MTEPEDATLKTFKCKRCGVTLVEGEEFTGRILGLDYVVVIKSAVIQCRCGLKREWRRNGRDKRDRS